MNILKYFQTPNLHFQNLDIQRSQRSLWILSIIIMDNHECREGWKFSVAGKSQEKREDGGEEYYNVYHAIMYIVCDVISWIFPTSIQNKYFISWQIHREGQNRDPQTKTSLSDGLCHQKSYRKYYKKYYIPYSH